MYVRVPNPRRKSRIQAPERARFRCLAYTALINVA